MRIDKIAQVAHEINAAFCKAYGDLSQAPWSDAPEWQKESAMDGVRFHMENPNANACASHNNWYVEKELTGWKYGEVKDADKKEHPCMVDFEALPPEQQAKDFLFQQVVHSLKSIGE